MRYVIERKSRDRYALVDTKTEQIMFLVSRDNRKLCESMQRRLNSGHGN